MEVCYLSRGHALSIIHTIDELPLSLAGREIMDYIPLNFTSRFHFENTHLELHATDLLSNMFDFVVPSAPRSKLVRTISQVK